jgi:hypothetical protein
MARKASKAAGIEQEPAAASPAERTGTPSAADASPSAERQAPDAEKRFAPDPFPLTTKNLDGYRLRLQQSRRFNQMQIKFGEGKLDDKPAQELIDFVKAPDGEDGPKFHWNNTDRAWGMRIDMNNPKTSREIAERVFDQVVERLRVEHGAALAR